MRRTTMSIRACAEHTTAPGFPLAVYLFIGSENSAALAEETGAPRRDVPRAVADE